MAGTLLVAGTASHVGKSTVVAGLCRRLADRGIAVAPFKAQNMSNNARVVPVAGSSGEAYGEIGVSQYAQARAAGLTPTTDHNPVLLKPTGDGRSQVVLDGTARGHVSTGAYYEDHWERARATAVDAYERLAANHDLIIAEGAGSIAEINLHDRDLANVETARFADAAILLVADIERGGAFASIYGTLELLPDDLRERVAGVVVTKFRGSRELLDPGIAEIERRTGVPVVGVLPYANPDLPAEDSLSLPGADEGTDCGSEAVTVGVVRLPRIANATDVDPLAREPGVGIEYVPPDGSLDGVDGVVVPGTKNTVDDLLTLREEGIGEELAAFDGPVVGICGGYQLLGERIEEASVERGGDRETVPGLGLLPVVTTFSETKRVTTASYEVDGVGPIAGASGRVSGYEIHLGSTAVPDGVAQPLGLESAATERVLGTYLHGLFDDDRLRAAFLSTVFDRAGVGRTEREGSENGWADSDGPDTGPFETARDLAGHIDLDALDASLSSL